MPQPTRNIIRQISIREGIVDFNKAPDELKFHVYKLTIKEMLTILRNQKLRTLPQNTLLDFEDSLAAMIDGFMDLSMKPLGKKQNLDKIMPTINAAYSHLSTALFIHREKGDTFKYFQHLLGCQDELLEILEQLEA